MPNHEESLKQQEDYPRMEAGEAIVMAPLTENKFDPDVVMIYGNVAQIMMLMCGLQKRKYENFDFSFLGEGDCSNSVARCHLTGKVCLTLGCYGERSMGEMDDGEIVLTLPPKELERAVLGLKDPRGDRVQISHQDDRCRFRSVSGCWLNFIPRTRWRRLSEKVTQ